MSYFAHPKGYTIHDLPQHQPHYPDSHFQSPRNDFHTQYALQPPLATPPASSQSISYSTDHSGVALPKAGQTRCYWTLLSSDLHFIYLDPVLASHLDSEADLLVGKPLLAFVHPDEQQTAKQDLGNVLDSKTLHGSVTRVRFLRLLDVRRRLLNSDPSNEWTEADKGTSDEDYLAVDIVINWAAEGLVLCFIHASADLSPNDNDERHKSNWTNWCETPMMSHEQIELLSSRLLVCIPQTGNMNRVFQILANQPDRQILLSWPPRSTQSSEPTSIDFAKLVEAVNLDAGGPGATDAKTSCTRRYKALHNTPIFGGEVESIFIPHGSIIFACHKVNPSSRNTTDSTAAMQQITFAPGAYNTQVASNFYDQTSSYPLSSMHNQDSYKSYMSQATQGAPSSYSPTQRWSQGIPTLNNLRSNTYITGNNDQSSWHPSAPPQPTYLDTSSPEGLPFNRPLSPSYTYSPTTTNSATASPISDVVPPPRRRISPNTTKEYTGPTRSASNRPAGILKCSSCKATSSPEWRKGPSGKKELCNACGLRYARSRAKKEGQGQRRRKDKSTAKREAEVTPVNTTAPYVAVRRNFADGPFASSNDVFPPSVPHSFDKMTPSPSPPSSNMNFVHYAPIGDSRSGYGPSTPYYPTPSPLSNPPYSTQTEGQSVSASGHHGITQLPPLGQISSFAGRLSPLAPSPSPVSHTSPAANIPMPSMDRDRTRDREYQDLPPTPLSAEPRLLKRSFCNSTK